ncbi:unnamed protein product [Schistosoma spindalis]|nr:unnamed protein product [Schistosoma spindale]
MLLSLLLIIYLVNISLLNIHGDLVSCDKLNFQSNNNDQKIIICSETYSEFDHYYYSQVIHYNQPIPIVDVTFRQINDYVEIPYNIKEILLRPMINNGLWCSFSTHPTPVKKEYSIILTDQSLIEDGTLVEFEPMSDVCDIQNTKDTCINTNRPESQCYWCSMIEKCSNGRDYYADMWMKNGCDEKNISQPQRTRNSIPKGMRESTVQTTNQDNKNSPNQCRRNSTSKGIRGSTVQSTNQDNVSSFQLDTLFPILHS